MALVYVQATMVARLDSPEDWGTPAAVSMPGLMVGDMVLKSTPTSSNPDVGSFEQVVSVADEIQYLGGSPGCAGSPMQLTFLRVNASTP